MAVFEADAACLLEIEARPSRAKCIESFMHVNVIKKFCSLCAHFNLDPLHAQALPCVILLMCKSRQGGELCAQFLRESGAALALDHTDRADVGGDMFSSISDWSTLLEYVDVELSDEDTEFLDNDAVIARLCDALREAKFGHEPSFLVLSILYMAPRGTLAAKMMERLCLRLHVADADVELRCMRFVTHFWDAAADEKAQDSLYVRLAHCLRVRRDFQELVKQNLRDSCSAAVRHAAPRSRLQLRHLAVQLHAANSVPYTQTFENWRATIKFGNTTSVQLQRLLYFITVQNQPPPEDIYAHLYTKDVLRRVGASKVERIDDKAVVEVIRSLRVYKGQVSDLLDFRTTCLNGLSLSTRKKLSLSQIVQLYTCIFQHDSVWDVCWRSVVGATNHTTISARDKFIKTHNFCAAAVCSNIIDCHVMIKDTGPAE